MGDQKRLFLRWRREVQVIDDAKKCKLLILFMDNLNDVVKNNMNNLLDDKDQKKKADAI